MTQAKLFGTDGIRGKVNVYPMRSDVMECAARAAATVFARSDGKSLRVLIAKDTRRSCAMVEHAMTAGFTSAGADVILAGVIPTPAVPLLAKENHADISVMISASHNPFDDNGIKIFLSSGHKLSDAQQAAMSAYIQNPEFCGRAAPADVGSVSYYHDSAVFYLNFLQGVLPEAFSLKGLRVVFDGAHGAGYEAGVQMLERLGADVIPVGCAPDGVNINASVGSTSPEALVAAVNDHKADIGIALDGDGDRVALCDENGRMSCGDRVVSALAVYFHRNNMLKGGAAVMTRISNMAAEDYLHTAGINFLRADVGDRYVTEMMRAQGCNIGGEKSGHIVLGDYASTGDGLLTALFMLRMMRDDGKKASEALHPFEPYPQIERNIVCHDRTKFSHDACAALSETISGMLECQGMAIIRPSGTEPLVRIMIQGNDNDAIARATEKAEALLHEFMASGADCA